MKSILINVDSQLKLLNFTVYYVSNLFSFSKSGLWPSYLGPAMEEERLILKGGRCFISSPPAFSNDAKKLLICTGNTVSVFSSSTGLQVLLLFVLNYLKQNTSTLFTQFCHLCVCAFSPDH